MSIRVLIAEDNDLFRLATYTALKGADPRIELVGEVPSAEAAVTRCGILQPDVIILDNHLVGDRRGSEVIPDIRRESPETVIIMFTSSGEDEGLRRADAVVLKSSPTPFLDIVDRIHHLVGPATRPLGLS